jgi:hypothetical protein
MLWSRETIYIKSDTNLPHKISLTDLSSLKSGPDHMHLNIRQLIKILDLRKVSIRERRKSLPNAQGQILMIGKDERMLKRELEHLWSEKQRMILRSRCSMMSSDI